MVDHRAPPRPRSDLERVLIGLEVVLAAGTVILGLAVRLRRGPDPT